MKKTTKILLGFATVFIAFGAVLVVGSLAFGVKPTYAIQSGALDFSIQEKRTSEFSQDGKYSIPADKLSELSVDWLNGTITVESYDGSEVILEEEGDFPLDKNNALMYTKENSALIINNAPSQIGISLSNAGVKNKELHIYLPEKIKWEKLKIDAQNTDIDINKLDIADVNIDVADGDFSLTDSVLEKLAFNSMEGNLTVKESQIEKVKADTTSGGINASFVSCPRSVMFDTLNGDAKMYLPKDSEFVLQMDTVSGTLDSEFSGIHSEECLTVGSGAAQFKMSTTDGSVQIGKNKN